MLPLLDYSTCMCTFVRFDSACNLSKFKKKSVIVYTCTLMIFCNISSGSADVNVCVDLYILETQKKVLTYISTCSCTIPLILKICTYTIPFILKILETQIFSL